MENASKSLIIAGAILISIFLISLGITIINSTKNSSKVAQDVGETMESSVLSTRIKTILSMIDYEDDDKFRAYIETNYGGGKNLTKNEVIELCEIIMARTQIIYDSDYEWDTIHLPSNSLRGVVYYDINNHTVHYEKLTDDKYYNLTIGYNNPASSIAIVINQVN